jgi:asparagine synthase (glutamine-hydrolysing)
MCGICGAYLRSGEPPDESLIIRMRDLMVDRGPDAGGLHVAPSIGLGTRRLRILDPTPAGEQPMSNEDSSVWVVFNGEIYNFEDLRAELQGAGHVFRSTGDTEVLVHGYEEWGVDLPRHLVGMFAFGVWDATRERLFLARDKLGKKPLFYVDAGDRVLFASDLKSVLAGLPGTPPLDLRALDAFLIFGAIPSPQTIFRGIQRLRSGEQVVFTASGASNARYWQLSFCDPLEVEEDEAVALLDRALCTAVGRRLRADAPVGVLLSGGVDSSVVVALMARLSSVPVEAFTIGSCAEEPEGAPLARQVAATTRARHSILPMPEDNGLFHWLELVWQYGQPFGDPSALPTYVAAKLARQRVKVVLTGDGGDEAFAGYARYPWKNPLARWQSASPAFLRRALASLGERRLARRPYDALGVALADQDLPLGDRLIPPTGWIRERATLYTDEMVRGLGEIHPNDYFHDWLAEADGQSDLARTLYCDYQSWLPDIMLTKVDVATMAVGLEARCPLVDQDVVQLAARLPDRVKVGRGLPPKYLLRRVAARYLPPEIAWQGKVGFRARQASTLRSYPELVRRLLSPQQLADRGLLRAESVTPIVEEYLRDGRHARRVWLLLWLELWMQMFLDGTLDRHTPWDELLRRV